MLCHSQSSLRLTHLILLWYICAFPALRPFSRTNPVAMMINNCVLNSAVWLHKMSFLTLSNMVINVCFTVHVECTNIAEFFVSTPESNPDSLARFQILGQC